MNYKIYNNKKIVTKNTKNFRLFLQYLVPEGRLTVLVPVNLSVVQPVLCEVSPLHAPPFESYASHHIQLFDFFCFGSSISMGPQRLRMSQMRLSRWSL